MTESQTSDAIARLDPIASLCLSFLISIRFAVLVKWNLITLRTSFLFLTRSTSKLLAPFYTNLDCGFGMTLVLASEDEQYILKIDKTVNWMERRRQPLSTIQFLAPGCVGYERAGVHYVLSAIMFKMTHALDLQQRVIHEQGMQKV